MAKVKTFKTIFPAVSVPLNDDFSINEAEFRVYLRWIKSFYGKGIEGLVCNGHTGEITGLTRAERKRVVEICAEECGDVMTIISGVNCENTQESIEMAAEAKAAGADYVGEMDLVEKIQKENWFDFDVVVATPDMMGVVGRLGKVLGPKGLMPSPKAGTVTMDVTKAVNEIKAGKVEYRLDKTNIIHCPIGKVSFGPEKLGDNLMALMGAIVKAKPAAAKGQYVKSCVAASTMGPGVKLNTGKFV